jgi:hypothetical protein
LITTMTTPPSPQNLDEAIAALSRDIITLHGTFPTGPLRPPSSHHTLASTKALRQNGPLGVSILAYTNYTHEFVDSFKHTPLASDTDSDHPVYEESWRLKVPAKRLFRSKEGYEDSLQENLDGQFLKELYYGVLNALTIHIFNAWRTTADDDPCKQEILEALKSLQLNEGDTGHATKADFCYQLTWKGEKVAVLRIELKHNGYALKKYTNTTIAKLIEGWRGQALLDVNIVPPSGNGEGVGKQIVIQVRFLPGCHHFVLTFLCVGRRGTPATGMTPLLYRNQSMGLTSSLFPKQQQQRKPPFFSLKI